MDINTKDNLIFSGFFAGIVTGIDRLRDAPKIISFYFSDI